MDTVHTIPRREMFRYLAVSALGAAIAEPLFAAAEPATPNRHAVLLKPEEGRRGKFGDCEIHFRLASEHTDGLLACTEMMMPPGSLGAPPHYHNKSDEILRVLEGTIHVMVGDDVFAVPAGGWHVRPRGLVHTFWNAGPGPARAIDVYVPGGHERYMSALADLFEGGKRPAPGQLAAFADRFDIVYRFDLLKGVMDKYEVHL